MGAFTSEQDLYDRLGRTFAELLADPLLAPQFQRADAIVQYRLTDPEAVITLDLRVGSEVAVELGPGSLEAEVVLRMAGDTAHLLFRGELNMTVALARGLIRARGPAGKILKLVPLLRPVCSRYVAQDGEPAAAVLA